MKRSFCIGVVATLLSASLAGCGSLPTVQGIDLNRVARIGQKAAESQKEYTEPEEIAIGREMSSVLLGAARLDPDTRLQTYVNRVGRWVASRSERPDLDWHFGVLADANINAYAAPGGYIFVTRGLLDLMESEAELAGVLAHEIGHVVRKHHLAAIQKAAGADLFGEVVGLAADQYQARRGDSSSVLKRELAEKVMGATRELYSRGLDREDEYQADRMGIVLAARAGYDAFGLPAVLQKIDRLKADDSALALMFKTHPKPADRLEHMDLALSALPAEGGAELVERFHQHAR